MMIKASVAPLALCIACLVTSGCASKTASELSSADTNKQVSALAPTPSDQTFARSCGQPQGYALDAVVRVASSDGESSGVVVASDYVLTAAHAVEDGKELLVWVDGRYEEALLIAFDQKHDLALLYVETRGLPSIEISNVDLSEKEPVWSVGFPLALQMQVNEGRYTQLRGGSIYASAATDAGASGGGLLRCDNGRHVLAGMIRAYAGYWDHGSIKPLRDVSISVPARAIVEFAHNAGLAL